jgi:LETM1 and EF-hand domain-containing protein 1
VAKHEARHYWNGTKLLYLQTSVSVGIVKALLRGQHISRRERRHLKRTVADMFRLVPFSFFVVVPFLEFTLPFFIKFFPNMLPSTYATSSQIDSSVRAQIKAKVSIAKFLQETVYDASKRYSGEDMTKFNEFVHKLRSGDAVDASDTLRFARLFKDDFTIDNLAHKQLEGLCKMLGLTPVGTDTFLRWQIERAVRKLRSDDQDIVDEGGVDKLDPEELRAACRERGIRTVYRSESFGLRHLREQLGTWLELSIQQKIPITLLLLTQAFAITQEGLQAALSAAIKDMPELVLDEATRAVEIDKRARRKLSIRIAENELQKIQDEEFTEVETKVQIEIEEAKKADVRSAERVVDAIKVAAGQQSLLADDLKMLEELRRRQVSASAERALERPAEPVAPPAVDVATGAAAPTGAQATLAASATAASATAAAPDAVAAAVAPTQPPTAAAAPVTATPAATVTATAADAAPPAPSAPPAPKAAAKPDDDPYQRRIQQMLDRIEVEVRGYDATVEELLKLIDKDRDGVIAKDEMKIAASLLRDKLDPIEFERVMKVLDTDGDNLVRLQELEDVVDKLEDRYADEIRRELEAAEKAKSRKVDADRQSAAAAAEAAAAVQRATQRAAELEQQRDKQTKRREQSWARRATLPPSRRQPPIVAVSTTTTTTPPPPQSQPQQTKK